MNKLKYNLFITLNKKDKLVKVLIASFDNFDLADLIFESIDLDMDNVKLLLVDTQTNEEYFTSNKNEAKKYKNSNTAFHKIKDGKN